MPSESFECFSVTGIWRFRSGDAIERKNKRVENSKIEILKPVRVE